jgi:hypothetical protein
MTLAERFNRTALSRALNSRAGRVFRLVAGAGFLIAGVALLPAPMGVVLASWSILPLTAGGFDVCWISVALGGPLAGARIRAPR